MPQSFESLVVWQKAMDWVTEVYKATRSFPKDEMYGLTSQLRRAATSVPCNIAEGKGRISKKEYQHFLGTARGSLMEARTQIQIARNLRYLPDSEMAALLTRADEIGRLLNGLLRSFQRPEMITEAEPLCSQEPRAKS